VFPLRLKDADLIKETFKLSQPGPALGPVTSRPLHIGHGAVVFPLLVIAFERSGPVRVTQFLVLLRVMFIEGHLPDQGILVGDGKHLL
jgi:hypothetical protein